MAQKLKSKFISILAIVSIIGFVSIAIESFTEFSFGIYVGPLIFIIIGIGLMIEGGVRQISKMLARGLTSDEVTHMLAIFIGLLAVVSGVLSLPGVGLETAVFLAFKGMLSIFAIFVIILEAWFVK